jgi:hypothetical protein
VHRIHYRFELVLVLILATLVLGLAGFDGDGARLLIMTLQAATLVAATIAARAHRWVIRLTEIACALLVAGAVVAVVGTDEFGGDSSRILSLLLVALAPPAIVSGLVKQFREERRVTVQSMFGVLCLYLLIGLLFASGFATIQEVFGRTFFQTGEGTTPDFLYFSFATLTTVGYGDLVAATDVGRSLAITEALLGQIYMVTVVALIVGNLGRGARPEGGPQRATKP